MIAENDTLADQAYRKLEEQIVTLDLSPGTVVSVSELSDQIEIGRTPLREALQRLADERLVDILPRRGVRVSDIHLRKHLALLETRRALDRVVVRRAARHAASMDRGAFDACATALEEAAQAGRLGEFMRLDRRFDEMVLETAPNPFAAEAVRPLHTHCRRFWYRFEAQGDLRRSARLHEQLMRTIAEGGEDQAADASNALIDYLVAFTHSVLDHP